MIPVSRPPVHAYVVPLAEVNDEPPLAQCGSPTGRTALVTLVPSLPSVPFVPLTPSFPFAPRAPLQANVITPPTPNFEPPLGQLASPVARAVADTLSPGCPAAPFGPDCPCRPWGPT